MAKGPNKTKTGARATSGRKPRASAAQAKAAGAKTGAKTGVKTGVKTGAETTAKPASKTQAKRAPKASLKRASKPARKAAPAGFEAGGGDEADFNKAALRAAFEKAMRGRGLDEAEDAFDEALDDLTGSASDAPADALGAAPEDQAAPRAGHELPPGGEMNNLLDFYSRILHSGGATGDELLDDMTQGFAMVLGSGPAFAALESMLSNVSAQGAVLMNAVQTQRQLDQIGLCCTSECVKQLMSMNAGYESD